MKTAITATFLLCVLSLSMSIIAAVIWNKTPAPVWEWVSVAMMFSAILFGSLWGILIQSLPDKKSPGE